MKLLLTSAGIKNPSINDAMLELLGTPMPSATHSASPPRRTGTSPAAFAGPTRRHRDQSGRRQCRLISEGHWKLFASQNG
ncbi:MAG TPA: hypothetical protein VES00_19030, partial [Burkholderiaceae bacterium]|nr:hypothetical protein [Burkholderiaceae bacterium]